MTARQRDENPAGIHLPLDPLPGHSSAAGWSACCGAASSR